MVKEENIMLLPNNAIVLKIKHISGTIKHVYYAHIPTSLISSHLPANLALTMKRITWIQGNVSLVLLHTHSIMGTGVMFALGRLTGTKQIRNVRIVSKEQNIMFWIISVNVKIVPLIRSVIQNVLLAHHLNISTLNWSSVSAAWRVNSLIPRLSYVFAQQRVPSKPIYLASAASYLNTLIILIRLARTARKTLFTILKISNVWDALQISLFLLLIDALLALIINSSISPLKIVKFALTVEITTRIKIYVNALLMLLSTLKLSAYHVFYRNISTSKAKNVQNVLLIWFMILAHINAPYAHLTGHF